MAFITPDSWCPVGIDFLEPVAWNALRHPGNTCVVAGPGAGKTEFLAQRATYLLQTDACPPPYKILAISFKSDAANNLNKRVCQRCPPEQADRFVSITFDAFTKGLVDRFHTAIPTHWRPTHPYEIVFPTFRDVDDFLMSLRFDVRECWQREIIGISKLEFEPRYVGTYKLPLNETKPSSALEYAINKWLTDHLFRTQQSELTFLILNRLAELILRVSPQIKRALRMTYPFVFVDEFQDTTYAQYDFLLSTFGGGSTSVTVVGDAKQRIMGWAGARPDAFISYRKNFCATPFQLLTNFRSSPDLVKIQHFVARALDAKVMESQSYARQQIDSNVAQIWNHGTNADEARQIARWLAEDMQNRGTTPRDYAILVRQTPDRFESQLVRVFHEAGLQLRNENRKIGKLRLQDLFAEELTQIGLALLRLGAQHKAPVAWDTASKAILHLHVTDWNDSIACYRAEKKLTDFLKELKQSMGDAVPTAEISQQIADQLFTFLDPSTLAQAYIEYGTGDTLALAIESFSLHLQASAIEVDDWNTCLNVFEGVDQIPLMTVHKSKGLEFDTMLFVGLDDNTWWSYSSDNPEGMATFFVALSRAKQRAIFTYCQERGNREKVKDLYTLLIESGVPEFRY